MIRNKRLVPDAVLDDEGRQRFHGAFTGGFSAGHYNTVGSEEGFKPTAFVSSRSNRASHIEQSANDFVDSEDGLLGAILSTNSEQVTIAVEDSGCVVKIPQAKANYFGIGYDPAVENPEISAYRNTVNQRGVGQGVYRMDALIPAASSGSRNSSDLLRNKGVGGFSLNDDEDDVYDNNNHVENSGRDGYTLQLSNKCRESDSDNEEQSFGNKARVKAKELTASVDKWLGSSVGGEKLCQRCPTDGKEVLSGFVLSTLKLIKPIVVFAPPPAPRGFTALHIFHEEKDRNLSGSSSNSTSTVASNYQRHRRGNSFANASNLGDVTATAGVAPVINAVSISELIQAAMKNMANKNLEKNNMQTSTIDDGYKEKSPKTFAEAVPARPMLTSDALLKSTFAGLSKAFQGRFVSSTSSSSNDSNALIAGLTTAAEHAEITAASFSTSTTSSTIAASTLTSNQQSSQSQSVSNNSHSNRNIPEVSSSSNGNQILGTSKTSKIQSLSNYKSDTLSSVTVKFSVKAEDNKTVTAIDSSSLKGKASRVSRAWYPVPLLSRRFNIKIDGENNGTKGGRQQQQQQLRQLESRTVDSQLDSMFAGLRDPGPVPSSSFSSSSTDIMPVTSFSSRKSLPSEREHDEFILLKEVKIEETPVVEKPPMSLFKSIFENGDSSDSSDDDTDDDDGKKDEKEDEKDEKEGVRESAQERDRVMEEKKKILLAKTVLELAKEEEIKSTASALVSKSILLGNTSKGKDTRVSASVAIPTDTHGQDLRNKEKSQIISCIKTINSGNNNNENNKSKNSDSSQSMVINLSRDGNGDDSVTTSNETEEKEKEIVSEEKGRVVFRKPVTKGKLNTFSNKSKNKRVVNVMSFKDEEEEEDEGTNGPRLISKIPSKIAKVKNEAFILSNTDNEELIIEEENVQLTLEGFTETMTAHNTHEEKEAGKEVVHKEEPTYVLGCTNLKADSMIETDETRTVTEWYARNEMKKKEREEIVRKLKYEEEMQVIAVMNQKLLCTDTVEHEKHKKERKRKHSNHTEEKEREKDRKNEKKSHKTLKSKKSKKSKKSSRDSCQSAKRQKGSGNDTNSSESESD